VWSFCIIKLLKLYPAQPEVDKVTEDLNAPVEVAPESHPVASTPVMCGRSGKEDHLSDDCLTPISSKPKSSDDTFNQSLYASALESKSSKDHRRRCRSKDRARPSREMRSSRYRSSHRISSSRDVRRSGDRREPSCSRDKDRSYRRERSRSMDRSYRRERSRSRDRRREDLVVEKGRAKRDPEVENVLLTTGTLRAEDILEKRRAHAMKRSLYPIKEARTLMKKEGVTQKTIEEMKEESPKEVGIEIASKQRESVRLLMKERKMKRAYRQKIRMLTKNLRSLKKRKLFGPNTRKNKSFVYFKLSKIY
jgi:hypothetical protein